MSHHSYNPDDIRKLRKMIETFTPTGATGQFPQGKLVPADEGEIRFAVGHANNKVVLDFGKPTAWIGMEPQQAMRLASSLIEHAKACIPSPQPTAIAGIGSPPAGAS